MPVDIHVSLFFSYSYDIHVSLSYIHVVHTAHSCASQPINLLRSLNFWPT